MRKLLYLLLWMCATGAHVLAQSEDVIPDVVRQAHAKQYPKADHVLWHTERPDGEEYAPGGSCHVFFKIDGRSYYVRYDNKATVLETQAELSPDALPAGISQAISAQYPGYQYQNITWFSTTNPGRLHQPFLKNVSEHYEVFIRQDKKICRLYYSADGKLLNKPEIRTVR